MADGFKLDLNSFAALATRFDQVPANLINFIDAEISDGVESIAAEARQRAPGDQANLRKGIITTKIALMSYEVASLALYSAYVEFGTRANVEIPAGLDDYAAQFIGSAGSSSLSAKEAIFQWCARKGIEESKWYAVYITLITKGGKPHPFFFPAVNRILPIIINRITKLLVQEAFK